VSQGKANALLKKQDRFQCRLRFCDFQSIEIPWDSSTRYKSSASDAELIYDVKRHRNELPQRGLYQSNRHRKSPQQRNNQPYLALARCRRYTSVTASAVSPTREKPLKRFLFIDAHATSLKRGVNDTRNFECIDSFDAQHA
jgi:hypothetical protein